MLRLRTTATWSLLIVAGAVGMAWWMSHWPRMQDRATVAALTARQHDLQHTKKPPLQAPPQRQRAAAPVVIQPARTTPPSAPTPVYAPSPAYPIEALRQQRGGVVTLRVSVDGHGNVTGVAVAHSSGDPKLDASARKTMRHWRFQAPQNHRPLTFEYPLEFRIGSGVAQ